MICDLIAGTKESCNKMKLKGLKTSSQNLKNEPKKRCVFKTEEDNKSYDWKNDCINNIKSKLT